MWGQQFFKNSFCMTYNNQHSTEGNNCLIWYGYLIDVWEFIEDTKKNIYIGFQLLN